jgi:Na+-translocating ferredoxin:NAD+ oxidoreductase RnfG subunit
LVGFLTTFFSKNMIIIMFFALVFTFILKNANSPSLEGLTTKDKNDKKESMKTSSNDDEEDEEKEKSSDKKSNKKKTTSSTYGDETDETDLKPLSSSSSSKNKTKSSKTAQENLVGSEFNSSDMNASEVISKIKKIVEVLQN